MELRHDIADLKTELLEAHADLEASLAREQIAAERVEGLSATIGAADVLIREQRLRIAELERQVEEWKYRDVRINEHLDHAEGYDFAVNADMIRAILAGDQGEEAT